MSLTSILAYVVAPVTCPADEALAPRSRSAPLLPQVKKGIQWLAGPRHEPSRLAGVLVLQELALHAPAVFNVHVRSFIEVIWNPLRDPKLQIREAAVAALQVGEAGAAQGRAGGRPGAGVLGRRHAGKRTN